MTLVEVMIAMTLFSLVALGLLGATLQSRRIAELNVMESTAVTVAQGCMEQLKRMPYGLLTSADLLLAHPEDTTDNIILTQGIWNRLDRALDINNTPNTTADDLIIEMRPAIIYMLTDASAPLIGTDCYEIFLDYRFQSRVFGTAKWHSGSLRLIRSFVRSYP